MASSLRKQVANRWFRMVFGPVSCVLVLGVTVQPSSRESVRAELIRLQDQYGLTVAWIGNNAETMSFMGRGGLDSGVEAVSFRKRTVILLKDSLRAFRPDGFSFGNIPRLATIDLCWSHSQSKLAATMLHPPNASLEIFDLGSKAAQIVESSADHRMHFTSQCWSPDDKQVAFETGGSVKVYPIGGDTASVRVLTKGTDVTWSPDGNWI